MNCFFLKIVEINHWAELNYDILKNIIEIILRRLLRKLKRKLEKKNDWFKTYWIEKKLSNVFLIHFRLKIIISRKCNYIFALIFAINFDLISYVCSLKN